MDVTTLPDDKYPDLELKIYPGKAGTEFQERVMFDLNIPCSLMRYLGSITRDQAQHLINQLVNSLHVIDETKFSIDPDECPYCKLPDPQCICETPSPLSQVHKDWQYSDYCEDCGQHYNDCNCEDEICDYCSFLLEECTCLDDDPDDWGISTCKDCGEYPPNCICAPLDAFPPSNN